MINQKGFKKVSSRLYAASLLIFFESEVDSETEKS